jgi:hypothetical protein
LRRPKAIAVETKSLIAPPPSLFFVQVFITRHLVLLHCLLRMTCAENGQHGISTESRSLARPPEGGLTRDDNLFPSSSGVMAERGNTYHRIRIEDDWNVDWSGRLIFFRQPWRT